MDQEQITKPSLWIFLLIVLAVLMVIVVGTSTVMQFVQAKQRKELQRRIANGEVDLETLGIKRLNVPQEQIEKMPQYKFRSVGERDSSTTIPPGDTGDKSQEIFQPTCSICLDDFVFEETQVRELPCRHIFHPECIDPFLRENSSLCPLCKRTALSPGVCPITVTNVMVRRERLTRQLGRVPPRGSRYPIYQPPSAPTIWTRRLDRIRGPSSVPAPPPAARVRNGDAAHGIPEEVVNTDVVDSQRDTELGPIRSGESLAPDAEQPPPEIARRGTIARRAWRRERVASLHAREYEAQAEETLREEQRRPLWRRVLRIT